MDRSAELREFLTSRRARVTPEQAGLAASSSRRRVAGLRREEVAQLAGLSVDYYVRLERGRTPHASTSVLDAVARALRLDRAEREHLFDLARTLETPRSRRPALRPQRLRPGLYELLQTIEHIPAMVIGRRLDVLASNRLARALFTDFEALAPRERNLLRFVFLDPSARSLYVHWDVIASELVASLRFDAGAHPDDPQLAELVGELCVTDEDFARWWSDHNVHRRTHGTKHFHHPIVGDLSLNYESLTPPADLDQRITIYTAQADSSSADALALLKSWSASIEPRVDSPPALRSRRAES